MTKGPTITKSVKMPVALNKRIEVLARSENNTTSAVIRRVLTAGITQEEAQQKERRAS